MARPREGDRVLPRPYRDGNGWRVVKIEGGVRTSVFCATEEDAKGAIRLARKRIAAEGEKSIEAVIKLYLAHLAERGLKPISVTTIRNLLYAFFPERDAPLRQLSPGWAAACYRELAARGVSVDYHRNALGVTRSFLAWCVKAGRLPANPLAKVEGVGRRSYGKPQLRIDEARLWLSQAKKRADEGFAGAVAAMVTLLMGLRCLEVVSRCVRDLDDGGRVLWVEGKTKNGKRRLRVPETLQPYLRALAEGRPGEAPLFVGYEGTAADRQWPRWWVKRICREADVAVVGAHSMRGLFATLAEEEGIASGAVARSLGHGSDAVTHAHYTKPEAVEGAKQRRALEVLEGGLAPERNSLNRSGLKAGRKKASS